MRNRRLNGYVLVYKPDHPRAIRSGGEKGFVYEHVLVAEKKLGRYIRDDEEVHHLDLNRANNLPRNLIVLSAAAHIQLHSWLRRGAPIADLKATLNPAIKDIVRGKKRYAKLVHRCELCEKVNSNSGANYCSNTCAGKASSKLHLSKREMEKLVYSGLPWTEIGRRLGVSDNGARKYARRLGITW